MIKYESGTNNIRVRLQQCNGGERGGGGGVSNQLMLVAYIRSYASALVVDLTQTNIITGL